MQLQCMQCHVMSRAIGPSGAKNGDNLGDFQSAVIFIISKQITLETRGINLGCLQPQNLTTSNLIMTSKLQYFNFGLYAYQIKA